MYENVNYLYGYENCRLHESLSFIYEKSINENEINCAQFAYVCFYGLSLSVIMFVCTIMKNEHVWVIIVLVIH